MACSRCLGSSICSSCGHTAQVGPPEAPLLTTKEKLALAIRSYLRSNDQKHDQYCEAYADGLECCLEPGHLLYNTMLDHIAEEFDSL